jgi:hypothetical protein
VSDGGLAGRGFDQDAAIVSGAKLAQAEFGGGKVIDAGFEVGEVPADQVELDLVQCSRAGSGAKVDFASRIFSVPGDAGREVEELGGRFRKWRKGLRLRSGGLRRAEATD